MNAPFNHRRSRKAAARAWAERLAALKVGMENARKDQADLLKEIRRYDPSRWLNFRTSLRPPSSASECEAMARAIPAPMAQPASAPAIRWPRWIALCLGSVSIATLMTAALIWAFFEPISRDWVASRESPSADIALRAMACGDAVLIKDDAGAILGTVRRDGGADCFDYHMTAPFEDEHAVAIAQAIVKHEGRYARRDLTFFGQDLIGLARAGISTLELSLSNTPRSTALKAAAEGKSVTFFPLAGSPPILSAFEALIGQANPISSRLSKIQNLRSAAIFEARALRGDDLARAHFLAERMTIVRVLGRSYAGAIAAEFLFGGPPETLGETCLFSAMAGFPIWQPYRGASDGRMMASQDSLDVAKRRAKTKCVRALAKDEAERAKAFAEIDAFAYPREPLPRLTPSLAILAEDTVASAVDDLPATLTFTVSRNGQARVEERVRTALRTIESKLAAGMCFSAECPSRAEYLVAVAEIRDESLLLLLRAAVGNKHDSLFGPVQYTNGHAKRVAPAFGLGSQSKVLLVALGAREGLTRYCNRVVGDVSNSNGLIPVQDCRDDPIGWVTPEFATSSSMNAPFADVAERFYRDVASMETSLGWLGEDLGPTGSALGIGRRPTAVDMMNLMTAISNGASGLAPASEGLILFYGQTTKSVDLRQFGITSSHAVEAARILAAPLDMPDGTLRSLRSEFSGTACKPILGKSGSPEIEGTREAMARSMTVVFECSGRRFVVFASISSGNGRTALGDIKTSDLAGLAREALLGVVDAE